MNVTLSINGYDISGELSTYEVIHERELLTSLITMDGTDHSVYKLRPSIQFSLRPLTDSETAVLYQELVNLEFTVLYTDPNFGEDVTAEMQLASSLESVFGLKSVNGNRYYKGSTIVLRQKTVL